MTVCLFAPASQEAGAAGHSSRLLAELLSQRHEVTLIHSGYDSKKPPLPPNEDFREVYASLPEELHPLKFACKDHRHSAAVMETLRRLYGTTGPDYLEVCDFRAHGLVPLHARQAADPLLAKTTVAIRLSPASELLNLHDGILDQGDNRRLAALEREQLRLADLLLWPGGECLDLYRRHCRGLQLPPDRRVRPPHAMVSPAPAPPAQREPGPLRLLFVGDLRRSSGVVDLVEACRALPPETWTLTMVGRDTRTAAMGQSLREAIEVMSGDDPRLEFAEEPAIGSVLTERLGAADLLVEPSRLGVSSATAITAMAAGVPVLAAPVGDLVEAVEDGVSGWLAEEGGSIALGRALCCLEADRDELERVRASGAPRRRALELTDPERILAAYDELLGERRPAAVRPVEEEPPLVTGVIPYYRASEFVAEAVASLLGQTHPRVEVLVVNDGSFEAADSVLDELGADPRVRVVTQVNRGEATARNLGARLAAGDYVVMLDADNVLEPRFVERGLEALRGDPSLVYATCWLRMIGRDGRDTSLHPGFAPLGNRVLDHYGENWDGDTLAMLPRRVFTELGFEYHPEGSMHSDWQLYRWMRRQGAYGAVVPERLARYRVLEESILQSYPRHLQERSWEESRQQEELEEIRWMAEVGT